MTGRHLLLVDDERDILDVLKYNFTLRGYEVTTAESAEEALGMDLGGIDLIILDVMLPGISGFRMAMQLKQDPATASIPIIFLTAKNAGEDVIDGLTLGADDYVTKPFSVQELILRVQAVLRRSGGRQEKEEEEGSAGTRFGGLHIDFSGKRVFVDGKEVTLSRTEYDLLAILASHQGTVFSRQQLLDKVWPEGVIVIERSVDVGITRLRKKLGRYAGCVITRPGFGYCFDYEEADS